MRTETISEDALDVIRAHNIVNDALTVNARDINVKRYHDGLKVWYTLDDVSLPDNPRTNKEWMRLLLNDIVSENLKSMWMDRNIVRNTMWYNLTYEWS